MTRKSILIFGVGPLQKSLIERCKLKGLFTVGIDPNPEADCNNLVDVFYVVGGIDFERTVEVALMYSVAGIITAATDKPLVMMARVAERLSLPFFSIVTAEWSTDKLLMKHKFQQNGVSCAKGITIQDLDEFIGLAFSFPVICKPRDNSGSRGVKYCRDMDELKKSFNETLKYTNKGSILVEEYIDGPEFSIESIHYRGQSYVLQITEKLTTSFPYNVELGHVQPADITSEMHEKIVDIVNRAANALKFDNCASHTELKISESGIKIIETSPRLGGDFISSALVPLSTGINMEDILIDVSVGIPIERSSFVSRFSSSSGIIYIELPEGKINELRSLDEIRNIEGIQNYFIDIKKGDTIKKITSSLNRYGYFIIQARDRNNLFKKIEGVTTLLKENIVVG